MRIEYLDNSTLKNSVLGFDPIDIFERSKKSTVTATANSPSLYKKTS